MLKANNFIIENFETIISLKEKQNKYNGDFWSKKDDEELLNFKKILKEYLKKQQNYKCAFCRQKIIVEHNSIWDIEHIVSKKKKPEWMFEIYNLCLCCKDCNTHKGEKNTIKNLKLKRYPNKGMNFLAYQPHYDNYSDHIILVEAGSSYIPKTEKGIKTIETYNLSRFYLKYSEIEVLDITFDPLIEKITNKYLSSNDPIEKLILMNQLNALTNKVSQIHRTSLF